MSDNQLPRHFLRYGTHKEQRYFQEFPECYDGVAMNGNMIAHAPSALAKFVGQLITNKPFLIDPQTHAFQHSPEFLMSDSSSGIKASVAKMCRAYGEPVESRAGKVAVLPADFEDPDRCKAFCSRVLQFQTGALEEASEDADYRSYLEYAGIKTMRPAAVIAPYFYMRPNTVDGWLDTNLALIGHSAEFDSGMSLHAQIVIDKEVLLRPRLLDRIIAGYGDAECDGVCLWIDDFVEHDADSDLLNGFIHLARSLGERGKSVCNIYGGYFSAILSHLGLLTGFCHGLEYGESRPVVPVGGGIPMAKYYFPPLHRRLRYREVMKILGAMGWDTADKFHENVCACETCREIIAGDLENFRLFGESKPVSFVRKGQTITLEYPLPETKDRCLRHYLRCKRSELAALDAGEDILSALAKIEDDYGRVLGQDGVAFAQTWIESLKPMGP